MKNFNKILGLLLILLLFEKCSYGSKYSYKQNKKKPVDYKAIYIFQDDLEISSVNGDFLISKASPFLLNESNFKFTFFDKYFRLTEQDRFSNLSLRSILENKGSSQQGRKVQVTLNGKKYWGKIFINQFCTFYGFNFENYYANTPKDFYGSINSRNYEIRISEEFRKEIEDGDRAALYETCQDFGPGEVVDSKTPFTNFIAWALIVSKDEL